MEFQRAREEVRRILRADLSDLAVAGSAGVAPPPAVRDWHIPERDRNVLSGYGLPAVEEDDVFARVGADFQPESEPPTRRRNCVPIGSLSVRTCGSCARNQPAW